MDVAFTVPGIAVAKERHRHDGDHTYTPRRTREFQDDVGWAAKVARVKPRNGKIAVTLHFYGCKGDADNLAKSVLDALNGIAYRDDRQVVELHVFVERDEIPARTEIVITPMGDDA